jgi:tetratricopeptide (TPR) repeat protein
MTRTRRLSVSAIALAAAFALFHAQLAAAVVTRGDDALRSGDVAGATRLYERALNLDPGSAIAADRLAFNLSMHHDRAHALQAIDVVTRVLRRSANDPALFADRAFAEMQLRSWRDAERDFAQAGRFAHDARYAHFAARMALHVEDRHAALLHAQVALAADASFAPARALVRALR